MFSWISHPLSRSKTVLSTANVHLCAGNANAGGGKAGSGAGGAGLVMRDIDDVDFVGLAPSELPDVIVEVEAEYNRWVRRPRHYFYCCDQSLGVS